jgi:hypothetical protein
MLLKQCLAPLQADLVKGSGSVADDQAEDFVAVQLRYQGVSLHQQFILVQAQRFDRLTSCIDAE